VSAENRLSVEQLAALAPGDAVTIESGAEFGRRRWSTGTVARITTRHVVVRSGAYVECYGLRDGVRDGGVGRAELINGQPDLDDEAKRRARQIDVVYREWTRNRTDVETVCRLRDAITEYLERTTVSVG